MFFSHHFMNPQSYCHHTHAHNNKSMKRFKISKGLKGIHLESQYLIASRRPFK